MRMHSIAEGFELYFVVKYALMCRYCRHIFSIIAPTCLRKIIVATKS